MCLQQTRTPNQREFLCDLPTITQCVEGGYLSVCLSVHPMYMPSIAYLLADKPSSFLLSSVTMVIHFAMATSSFISPFHAC